MAPSAERWNSMSDAAGDASSREWNATAYHALSEPQFLWGMRVLGRIQFSGDECALDAGCGSGRLTKELRRKVPRGSVVACDLSENMAHAAGATLGRGSAIVCADLSSLPFRAAFDLVFSTATFHWIHDHTRLFTELRQALKPGGRLEAQCGGGPNLAAVHARAEAVACRMPFSDYFESWRDPWLFADASDTEARLRAAGFSSAHCALEPAPTVFPDARRYRAFLETVVMRPFLTRLPGATLRSDFLDAMVAEAASDDPPYALDYWRLNITATTI